MKLFPILACSLALLLSTSAFATDERTEFLHSLAVPLSRAETRQLEALSQAQKTANAAADAPGASAAALSKAVDANEAFEKFKESKRLRLPREIRRTRPINATGLYLGKHQVGAAAGEPMLVHVWTVRRKADKSDSYLQFGPSPFHLDVFRRARGTQARGWRRAASTVYEEHGGTINGVEVRYLREATKQSPVLVLYTSGGMATTIRVVTYPGGMRAGGRSFAQSFSAYGSGGGAVRVNFGVDGRGMMTVIVLTTFGGRLQNRTVYAWNGREYAARAVKQ